MKSGEFSWTEKSSGVMAESARQRNWGGLGVLWLCAAFQISCSGQAEMFPTVLQLTAGLESSGVCGP